MLQRTSDISDHLLEPPGSLAVLPTRLALARRGKVQARYSAGRCGGLNGAAGLLRVGVSRRCSPTSSALLALRTPSLRRPPSR